MKSALSTVGSHEAQPPMHFRPIQAHALPPSGATPAGDLQRRISDAALLGFFAEPTSDILHSPAVRLAATLFAAAASWAAVFGAGAALLR